MQTLEDTESLTSSTKDVEEVEPEDETSILLDKVQLYR
jgi:hypothetical protein